MKKRWQPARLRWRTTDRERWFKARLDALCLIERLILERTRREGLRFRGGVQLRNVQNYLIETLRH